MCRSGNMMTQLYSSYWLGIDYVEGGVYKGRVWYCGGACSLFLIGALMAAVLFGSGTVWWVFEAAILTSMWTLVVPLFGITSIKGERYGHSWDGGWNLKLVICLCFSSCMPNIPRNESVRKLSPILERNGDYVDPFGWTSVGIRILLVCCHNTNIGILLSKPQQPYF